MTGYCASTKTSECRHSSVQSNDGQSSEQTLLTSYDIDMLRKTKKTYKKDPLSGYLKINCLRTKILNLKERLHKALIDIWWIETKLDETFADAPFVIENYQVSRFRRDRNKKWGGKMVYIEKELKWLQLDSNPEPLSY